MMFLPVFKGGIAKRRTTKQTVHSHALSDIKVHTWERIYDKHERFFDCFTFVVLKIGDFP